MNESPMIAAYQLSLFGDPPQPGKQWRPGGALRQWRMMHADSGDAHG